MKRLFIMMTLPILACGGLAETITPSAASLTPLEVAATPQPDSSPQPDAATESPIGNPVVNAGSFPNPAAYQWKIITSGLNRPVDIQSALDGSNRLFIIEKYGVIRIYENSQLLEEPFLNIDDRVNDDSNEMGLLGFAFHPDYEHNGFFYVNYTGQGGHTRISRFHASGNSADPNSESVLMLIEQPYPNHNGGAVAFGKDGYLYLGLGDGGLANDPHGNGQNLNTLLGKILRIDVNQGDQYAVPADNPFVNTDAKSEIWAYGLRNPWRFSFDRATGDLYIGDVGQGDWEEVDYVPFGQSGLNFGWKYREGTHHFIQENPPLSVQLTYPVAEYSHADTYGGCSVTGGYVYRGAMPEWNGIYLYGDYCTGIIWGLILADGEWQSQLLFEADARITSFGQDESGEVYLASDAGDVYILVEK